jgi:ribosomal peptide maturation radical SAM protein 1
MNDILLLCMPFGNVFTPALGISLLRDELRLRGNHCDIKYLQLRFANMIGVELYNQISDSFPSLLLGEWLFTHHLFDNHLNDPQDFLDKIVDQYTAAHGRSYGKSFIDSLLKVREATGAYLDDCLKVVEWDKYEIIGFTSTFAQHLASLAMAKRIKDRFPEKIIIFGGANCEDEMGLETHRQFPFVDFVCSGEGDILLPNLVERLSRGQGIEDIPGLIYRREGESRANDSSMLSLIEMDSTPFANFDDYFDQLKENNLDIEPSSLRLMMETSRGCWWGAKSHCTFCGLNGNTMTFRSKSSDRVLEEFIYLSQRYPEVKQFAMVDNILDIRYFRDVIPDLIENDLDLSIWYEVKANIRKEQIKALKLAKIDSIQPGIESLDSEILRLMRKGCTAVQNVQTLKWARQYGLYVGWNLISGFPGEKQEAYQRMADLVPSLVHLQPPTSRGVSRLRLDRFSPYFYHSEDYGITNVHPVKAYSYIYPFPEKIQFRLAYYFDFDYSNNLSPESYTGVLDEAIAKWHDHQLDGSLQYLQIGENITLYDTRVSAHKPETVLKGMSKVIYEFCDEGRNLGEILRHLQNFELSFSSSIEAFQVKTILDEFVEARLMLFADDHYLSLAIPMQEEAEDFIERFVAAVQSYQPTAEEIETIYNPVDNVASLDARGVLQR